MIKRVVRISMVAAVILLVVWGCTSLVADRCSKQVMAGETPVRTRVIVDAGHGGTDGGAIGVDGIVEKDLNLDIALTLRDMLVSSGFEVVMTRETDCSIHDANAKTIKQQKTSDLRNRLAFTKKYPDAIFVSVHQNQFPQGKYKGAQVFYGRKTESSQVLATILQGTMMEQLDPSNNRKCKLGGKELYLLYQSDIPSVLVECGFLSNPEEAKLLATKEYRNKVAFSIYSGIMRYTEASTGQNNSSGPTQSQASEPSAA